jgi:hypothetical protein
MFPKQRAKGLLTEELPEETIVYDTVKHKVHCLNPIATRVWQNCNGQTSEAQLAEILRQEFQLPADEALVQLTLEQLAAAGLLEGPRPLETRTSRREVARQLLKYGVAAAVALVATTPAPTMAQIATNNCQQNSGSVLKCRNAFCHGVQGACTFNAPNCLCI